MYDICEYHEYEVCYACVTKTRQLRQLPLNLSGPHPAVANCLVDRLMGWDEPVRELPL